MFGSGLPSAMQLSVRGSFLGTWTIFNEQDDYQIGYWWRGWMVISVTICDLWCWSLRCGFNDDDVDHDFQNEYWSDLPSVNVGAPWYGDSGPSLKRFCIRVVIGIILVIDSSSSAIGGCLVMGRPVFSNSFVFVGKFFHEDHRHCCHLSSHP